MSGFGRSNSLSINTGASNSLFSAASKPPASGGLFSNASSNPPTGGLFGGPTANSQPQQSGGLFGNLQKPAQPSSGGLFGNTQQASQPTSGGLFGNTQQQQQQQQSQPQQSNSLFGGAQAQNQPQNQAAGGLFGNLGGQQNKPATPSLFSNAPSQQPQQQQQQQAGGLFGNSTNQQQQTPSLFGGLPKTQPAQSSNLFGTSTSRPTLGASNAGGGSVPGVKIDLSNIKSTTRFSELHEDIQKEIVRIDDLIQQQISYKEQITAAMSGHSQTMSYIPNDVSYLQDRLNLVETVLDNDASDIQRIKETITQDAKDARLSFTAIENLKLPSQFHHHPGMGGFSLPSKSTQQSSADGEDDDGSTDLTSYFNTKHKVIEQTLQQHNKHLSEIESHLKTVEVGTMRKVTRLMEERERGQMDGDEGRTSKTQEDLRELGEALRAVETMILSLAGKVGEAREGVIEVTLGAVGR